MRRDLRGLADQDFDLLVIGGGIYGAAATWDAAQRGLRVALVEANDFGSGVSWNSLKTIHGGLRHLQRADVWGVRESVRERRALARIAPQVVKPLSFLIPTRGHGIRGREALWLALLVNDVLGLDRNRGLDRDHEIPPGRVLSRKEVLAALPGVPAKGLSGGAVWSDAQVESSERLLLGFLHSAAAAGASLANYLEIKRFRRRGERIVGAVARDRRGDDELEIRARMVLNAAGPDVDRVLALADVSKAPVPLLRATNLVLKRAPVAPQAVGAASRGRYLFLVPWQNQTIVGTDYEPAETPEAGIDAFLEEVRHAFSWAGLTRDDVSLVHRGLVPGRQDGNGLWTRHRLFDHEAQDARPGLISMVGVKYTTARRVAEQAVSLVFRRLGKDPPRCQTAEIPLRGIELPAGGLEQQTRYAVREEMALTLADAVLRRLDLGTGGPPAAPELESVELAMASELGWSREQMREQARALAETYRMVPASHSG
jgi:glycerol-3-phosphate dehydrogenase